MVHNKILFTDEQVNKIIELYTVENQSTVTIGNMFNVYHKVIARVLEENNIPRTGKSKRKYLLNENYFDSIDTPNKAYILGLLYADGYNSLDKGTIRLQLQYTDKDLLEEIRKELGSNKPLKFIKCSDRTHSNGYVSNDMYSLEFYSMHMCKTLESIGMVQNKSLILEFPELKYELYSHFIRGYFDGDGSYCSGNFGKKKWAHNILTITSTESFCIDVLSILRKECYIGGGIYESSSHNGITKVLSISGYNQVKRVLDWLYNDADIYLKRKHEKYIVDFKIS